MSQSSFIAAALLAGFVLYVAAKNRLSVYTGVLWGPTNASLPPFLGIPLLNVGSGATASSGATEEPSATTAGSSASSIGSALGEAGQIGSDFATALEFLG